MPEFWGRAQAAKAGEGSRFDVSCPTCQGWGPAACAAPLLSLPCSPAAFGKCGKGALFWQEKQDCKSVDKNRANKGTVQDAEKDETKIYVKTAAALTH